MFDAIRRAGGRYGGDLPLMPAARLALWMALLCVVGAAQASAPRSAIPARDQCRFLELRMAEGWFLQIRRDQAAAYGFGALAKLVFVEAGTFSLDEIYGAVIDHVVAPYPDARVNVVFSPMAPGYEGWVFALAADGPDVSALFATAYRARDLARDDGLQHDAIRDLDPFWAKAPFLQ
jgi:hypothetical protein